MTGEGETALIQGLRDAVRLQRSPPIQAEQVRAALLEAERLSQIALEASKAITTANDLEGMMVKGLLAVRAHEDAETRLAAIKAEIAGMEAACAGNAAVLREAMAPVFVAGLPFPVEDETHTATGTSPPVSMVITEPDLIPLEYIDRPTFRNRDIKAALLAGKSVPGAKLVYGAPGVKISAKIKSKGRKQ